MNNHGKNHRRIIVEVRKLTSKEKIFECLDVEYLKIKIKLESNNITFTNDIHLDIPGGSFFPEGKSDFNTYNQINFIRKCLVLNYWNGDVQDDQLINLKNIIREIAKKY